MKFLFFIKSQSGDMCGEKSVDFSTRVKRRNTFVPRMKLMLSRWYRVGSMEISVNFSTFLSLP